METATQPGPGASLPTLGPCPFPKQPEGSNSHGVGAWGAESEPTPMTVPLNLPGAGPRRRGCRLLGNLPLPRVKAAGRGWGASQSRPGKGPGHARLDSVGLPQPHLLGALEGQV